jgi:hypothetical protein
MNIDTNFINLRALIEKLKTVTLWQRIFGWSSIRKLFIDAFSEFEKISLIVSTQSNEITKSENDLKLLQSQYDNLKSIHEKEHDALTVFKTNEPIVAKNLTDLTAQVSSKDATIVGMIKEIEDLKIRINTLQNDLSYAQNQYQQANDERNTLKQIDATRQTKHDQTIVSLESIKEKIEKDREVEISQQKETEEAKREALNSTWARHQTDVKERMKVLAQKLIIEYIENVPFKGTPDNTLKICDEYVVFDAKSPRGEDLTNFPTYLKKEAEAAKKYASKDDVKSDIFFVVPSNTLEKLDSFVHKFGDYTVFVVSIDSIEPVIVGLKRIEDYEFAEQLSPEDREDICRIIGRFAHLSKRRIQVDNFFAKHFIELAYKCENELPDDILKMVLEYEKSEKLNPPQEKKVKNIPTLELENNNKKLKQEAEGRGILIENTSMSNSIDEIPLYKSEAE